MRFDLRTPAVDDFDRIITALKSWQADDGPLQLHSGDVGWFSTKGATATAAALRVWSSGKEIRAIGLLDGPDLLRMAMHPATRNDDAVATQIAADLDDPGQGVFEAGNATVEARGADTLTRILSEHGWQPDEPWTPFSLALSSPVRESGVAIVTAGPDDAPDWADVHWAAFHDTPPSDADRRRYRDRLLTMMRGPFSADARCLVAYDAHDNAVAVATAWSAGLGRPGLLEPIGVHRDFRGKGYGRAITLAAAATLREMGASSAIVCAESANVGAVATYLAAGFSAAPEVRDMRREPAPARRQ